MGRDRSRSRGRGGDDRDRGRGGDDRGRDRGGDRGREERPRSRERQRRDRSREKGPKSPDPDRERPAVDRSPPREERSSRKEERREEKPEKEEKEDETFRPGRLVMVKGLQKNPEKNGSVGSLVEYNSEKGRWVVSISGGNNNFKEDNLELMADNSDVIDENEEPPTAKIYITKLPAETTDKDLIALFGSCGLIEKAPPKSGPKGFKDQWPYDVKVYKPGRENGDACVTYMDPQSAKAAIKTFNRYKYKGNKIGVAYAGQGRKYEQPTELKKAWYLREENQGKLDREGGGGGGKDGGKSGPKPGDWQCAECGADVFASKDSCFKCGASKPGGGGGGKGDGGKGDGGKGGSSDDKGGGKGGGGKAGDWTCPGCNANVFASKDSCFKCGEQKPGGGGGGGKGGKGRDRY